MNIREFASIVQVVLMLCAAGAFISGIMKAKRARKNGHSGIPQIVVGVILAILAVAGINIFRSALDNCAECEYIKAQHPMGVLNITYGQALDKVCGNQKWYPMTKEASSSGKSVVQMDADCNYNGSVRSITIQFNYGVRDFAEIDANTPFQITFVGFDDSEETSVSVMQDLIYEMFAHYAADNGIGLDTSVKDTILYSSGWDTDKITSNKMEPAETKPDKTETATVTEPRKFSVDGGERKPMFEQFSALLYQRIDFSGMSDEEIQSYLENAYTQWLSGEAYEEIVFDENYELTIQDTDDASPTVAAPAFGEVNEEMLEEEVREHVEQWFAEHPLIYYDYEIELSDEWTSGADVGCYWYDLYIGDLYYDVIWIDVATGGIMMGEGDASVPIDQWYTETWLPLMDADAYPQEENAGETAYSSNDDAFIGSWSNLYESGMDMEITCDDGIHYQIDISKIWNPSEIRNWHFIGYYDTSLNGLVYSDGVCLDMEQMEETFVYTDGDGAIMLGENGFLYWIDDEDYFADESCFVPSGD